MLVTGLKNVCFFPDTETPSYSSNSSRVGQVRKIESPVLGRHFLVHLQLVKDQKKQRKKLITLV